MLKRGNQGLAVVCVAESSDTPGRQQAIQAGMALKTLDEIVALGHGVDVIFDLTGRPEVRRELRDKLVATENRHTVIASETIARVIWALISQDALPVIEGRVIGY